MANDCKNCAGTGWVACEVPGQIIDGVLHMRERINPCHLCNAGGVWSKWAQEVVDAGRILHLVSSQKDSGNG